MCALVSFPDHTTYVNHFQYNMRYRKRSMLWVVISSLVMFLLLDIVHYALLVK